MPPPSNPSGIKKSHALTPKTTKDPRFHPYLQTPLRNSMTVPELVTPQSRPLPPGRTPARPLFISPCPLSNSQGSPFFDRPELSKKKLRGFKSELLPLSPSSLTLVSEKLPPNLNATDRLVLAKGELEIARTDVRVKEVIKIASDKQVDILRAALTQAELLATQNHDALRLAISEVTVWKKLTQSLTANGNSPLPNRRPVFGTNYDCAPGSSSEPGWEEALDCDGEDEEDLEEAGLVSLETDDIDDSLEHAPHSMEYLSSLAISADNSCIYSVAHSASP